MRPHLLLIPLLMLAAELPAIAAPAATPPANVRIYRCVGSNGAVALQDSPCSKGQQQVLDMQRPQDPPPRAVSSPAESTPAVTPAPLQREIRIVTVQPPQPMYECVTTEGARYTSDNNEGNPRWEPVWGYGRVMHPGGHPHPPGGGIDGGFQRPGGVIVPMGSALVRDSCHALPPQEVCARLKDRRWELIRRYNSALQSEREKLVREQRGIDARLEQDCGGT